MLLRWAIIFVTAACEAAEVEGAVVVVVVVVAAGAGVPAKISPKVFQGSCSGRTGWSLPLKMHHLELFPSPMIPWLDRTPRLRVVRERLAVLEMASPTT